MANTEIVRDDPSKTQVLYRIDRAQADTTVVMQTLIDKLDSTTNNLHKLSGRMSALDQKFMEVLIRLEKGTSNFDGLDARIKKLELIVYGAVGMVLTSVFGSLIYLVVRQGVGGEG